MASRAKRVLVGGGSGFVGGQLAMRLRQCGFQPLVLGRDFDEEERSKRGNTITYAELQEAGRIPKDTFAVVNLAGANIGVPFRQFNEDYKEIVRASRVGTTALLRRLILGTPKEERPSVFVSSSAVGIYPPSSSALYDEDSVPHGCDPPGDFFQFSNTPNLCRDWEAAAKLDPDSGVRHVIVRLENKKTGLVLGRTGGIVEQSIMPFSLGLGGPMGSGSQWFPWVHVDDVCGIILHSLENSHVSGVLNAVAPNIVTNKGWAKAFGSALNRPAVIPMPELAVTLLFGSERAQMFLTGQNVRPKRTLESGYEFIYPTVDEAAKEVARHPNEEELKRLKSYGTPISRQSMYNFKEI